MARVLQMRSKAKAPERAAKSSRPAGRGHGTSAGPRQAAGSGSRPLWRGFLAFGLVQVPIELLSAEASKELSFDLLDRRDMAPIGYRKYNKETGEEVPSEEIVRGIEVSRGRHVIVSDAEIEAAAGEASRTFEIREFVERDAVPPAYFERPLQLVPAHGGEKVYALLARALHESGKIGLGTIVLRTRESLAALVPLEDRLMLELLRWPHELRRPAPLPEGAKPAKNGGRELDMARRLIDEMSGSFEPSAFADRFRDDLVALIRKRARTGAPPRATAPKKRATKGTNVVDLVALLEKSVRARHAGARGSRASRGDRGNQASGRRKRSA